MSDWKNVQYKDGKMRTSKSGGGGSSTLAGLDDVDLDNLQDGQIIKWDATNEKFINANESGGSSSHTYSTTEQVVGTWTNGKPVYEILVDCNEFQGSTNQWITTPVNIPNGEWVVSCGFAQHSSLSGNFLYTAFCKFDSSGNLLAWFSGSTYYYARCLIRYTKTTD